MCPGPMFFKNDPSFIYANQLPLGSPRTYEVSIEASL